MQIVLDIGIERKAKPLAESQVLCSRGSWKVKLRSGVHVPLSWSLYCPFFQVGQHPSVLQADTYGDGVAAYMSGILGKHCGQGPLRSKIQVRFRVEEPVGGSLREEVWRPP